MSEHEHFVTGPESNPDYHDMHYNGDGTWTDHITDREGEDYYATMDSHGDGHISGYDDHGHYMSETVSDGHYDIQEYDSHGHVHDTEATA